MLPIEIHQKKSCCFVGHRKIIVSNELINKLTTTIKDLIINGITVFNFGSHSDFDSLCYDIVIKLKSQYNCIITIHYCIPYENYTATGFTDLYDYEIDCEKAFKANKKSYMARNFEMIDNSDICVFYYDKAYTPPRRKNSKKDLTDYQPKSGTAIAYQYAKQKKKKIINIQELL